MKREISNEIFQAYYAVWFKNGLKRTDLTAAEEAWIDAERERFHALEKREREEQNAERWFEDEMWRVGEEDGTAEYDYDWECWRSVPDSPFICRDCRDPNLRTMRWVQNRWSEYPEYYCLDCMMTKDNRNQMEADIIPWSTDRSG